jgi:uncharacterized phosphatase
MTLIFVVRHGETDWNRQRRIQGSTDIPLNSVGREQALATGRLLALRNWDAIITSPLLRARETAEIIASVTGRHSLQSLDDIAERRYGDAEGLTYEQVEAQFPGDSPVPGRESRESVALRAVPALITLADRYPGQSIVVVSHGGVIRSLLVATAVAGVTADSPGIHTDPIRNGSIHTFRHTDGALDLISFDDPIVEASSHFADLALGDQNAVERRDAP